mmetsp:Transcript_33627/g.106775  ORF Transcript_33627/g.106775 Transcript_33627/m.106775 type:complete len:708 (+) Transcript_33627:833-2956(+)
MELLVEPCHLIPLHVQLQAVLTNEGHAHCDGLGTRQAELAPLEGLEDLARQVHWLIQDLLDRRLGIGAVDEEHRALARDVLDLDLLIGPHVLAHPPQVVELVVGVACNVELLLREAHKGQLRVDLARGRQQVPQAHAAHGRQLVRDKPVQEGRRTSTLDAVVREGPVAEAGVVHHLLALLADAVGVRGPLEGGHGVAQVLGRGVEPAGRLPAVGEAELSASCAEHGDNVVLGAIRVHHRPGTGPVLIEVGSGVVPAVGLFDLLAHPGRRGPGAVARGVRLRELVGRLALEHPVHDVAREPGRMGDAVGLRTSVPVVPLLVRRAHEVVAVRRPARRPVQHRLDAHGLDRRHEARGRLHAVHEAVDVALEEPVGELRWHGALPLRGGQLHDVLVLVRADKDAVALVAEVVGALEVPQHGQLVPVLLVVGLHLGHGLGDDVLVLQHHGWRVHAREAADALGPEAGAVHHPARAHNVGLPAAGLDGDLPRAVRQALQAHNLAVLVDPAAHGLSLAREGLRHRRRVDVAVALGVECRDDALRVHQGMEPLDLLRGDEIHLRAAEEPLVELRLGECVLRLLHALLVLQQPYGARLVEGEQDALLVLPLLVELHALLVPELEVVAAVVVGHQARCVPGGAGGERGLLEDGRRGAEPPHAQLVQDGCACHAAADDCHVELAGQVRRSLGRGPTAAHCLRHGRQELRAATGPAAAD